MEKNMFDNQKISCVALVLIALTFGLSTIAFAQYKCEKVNSVEGSITECYHTNGVVSTSELWDLERNWGRFKAYNHEGVLLVEFELRRIAGHARVEVSYYANGQVSRLEYSSAPDGGIQYWEYIYTYSEEGKETSRIDLSRPDGFPRLTEPDRPILEEQEPPKPWLAQPQKFAEKKEPYLIRLMNLSNRTINLKYIVLADSTTEDLMLEASNEQGFTDTLMVRQGVVADRFVAFEIQGRMSKRFEVREILSNDITRIYAIVRRNKHANQAG
jgi:hypothetical protein